MKILVFNNGYLSEALSGGDKHVIDIAEQWVRKHHVTFMLPDFAVPRLPPYIHVIKYHSIKPKSVVSMAFTYFLRTLRGFWVACRTPADIVITSVGLFDLWPALVHKHKYGSKVAVYAYHLAPPRKARRLLRRVQSWAYRAMQRVACIFFSRANVVLTCNDYVKHELVSLGVPNDMIKVRYLSVNVEGVQNAQPIRKYNALFVGRIVVQKGIYDIVEAVRGLNVSVGLVGEGEEMVNLQKMIRKYGMMNRIELLGYLPDNGPLLYSLLKGCDFFLFPSYEEGYGIVVAEAIVAQKPVIAYELPHYKKAFNDSLITSPIGDVTALKRNIEALISGRIDVNAILKKYRGVDICNSEMAAARDLTELMTT